MCVLCIASLMFKVCVLKQDQTSLGCLWCFFLRKYLTIYADEQCDVKLQNTVLRLRWISPLQTMSHADQLHSHPRIVIIRRKL